MEKMRTSKQCYAIEINSNMFIILFLKNCNDETLVHHPTIFKKICTQNVLKMKKIFVNCNKTDIK